MTVTQRRRQRRRRRAWKTAGSVLLGLLSGAAGCQECRDHLQHVDANASAAIGSTSLYRPRSAAVAESANPQPAADPSGQGVIPTAESAGASNAIIQTGATTVVRADSSASSTAAPATRISASRGNPDGPDEEERDISHDEVTARSTSPTRLASAQPADKAGIDNRGQAPKPAGRSAREYQVDRTLPSPTSGIPTPVIPTPARVQPISLAACLVQAGVENPVIGIARQAVQSALGLQIQARALLLPNINIGTNYYLTNGPIQASFGAIRKVDRDGLYYGLGAGAYVAGTVNIPGVFIDQAFADVIFEPLIARNVVANRRFLATATRNDIFLEVCTAYLALLGAEGELAVIRQSEADFDEIARLTAAYLRRGLGVQADADRARASALELRYHEQRAQKDVAVAAADLSHLLNLDPTTRLITGAIPIQVVQFVDPTIPLPKLLDIATQNRPEVLAAIAAIRASQARVRQEKYRPFLPILWTGLSAGDFGGGAVASTPGFNSSAQQGIGPQEGQAPSQTPPNIGYTIPKFGKIAGRIDVDVMALWQLQNMGFGNIAHVRERRAQLNQAQAERLRVLNEVARQVNEAYSRSAENFRTISIEQRRVQEATEGLQLDLTRYFKAFNARPIEVLDNAQRLLEARQRLLSHIIAFDRAQFELFVALGQPPTLVVEEDKPTPPVPPGNQPPEGNAPPPGQLPAPRQLPNAQ